MANYEYVGIDKKGKSVKGHKEADGVKTLRLALRSSGIFVTKIKETHVGYSALENTKTGLKREVNFKQYFERINVETIALATRQLATLLQSGVPMIESLRALVEQVDNEALKRILSQVRADVNEGLSLADAMAKHKCFSNVYVNMVRAGESSGALELVLDRLADFTEGQSRLQSKVLGALTYPLVMMVVAFLLVLILMTTVVPKITALFASAKVQLPFMTRMLIATSAFLASYWWLVIIFLILVGWAISRQLKPPAAEHGGTKLSLRYLFLGLFCKWSLSRAFLEPLLHFCQAGCRF